MQLDGPTVVNRCGVDGPAQKTICIVDDDASMLRAQVRALCSFGLTALPFQNPRSFLEYVENHSVAVAVLDLWMPELTGLDVQRVLSDISPRTAVIMVTGDLEPGNRKRVALSQGAIAFFVKPIPGPLLLEAIQKALIPAT
jgi:FixJ family two-component response regulator